MTKIVKTEAFVLKTKKYGDTSKIVTLYTKQYGKINCIAKGARNTKSKFSSCLNMLSHIAIIFYKKETTHLHLISDCDLIKSHNKISENIEKLEISLKIIELIYRVLHDEEESPELFRLIEESLNELDTVNKNVENVYFNFLIKLGEILGYKYNFQKCGKCSREINSNTEDVQYIFDFTRGAALCKNCENEAIIPRAINLGMLRNLNKFEVSTNISNILNIGIDNKMKNEIEKFLFEYLRYHISGLKELKTQKIFNKLLK